LSVGAALAWTGANAVESLLSSFRLALDAAARPDVPLATSLAGVSVLGLRAAFPILAVAALAGGLAVFVQVGPVLSWKPGTPELARMDPVKGAKSLLSRRRLADTLRAIAQAVVVGAVAWLTLAGEIRGVVGLAGRDPGVAAVGGGALLLRLLLRAGAAMAVIGVLDHFYQRARHRRDLRMTKDEVRREHRESEGDPRAKQARQRAHREIVEHSLLEAVRDADVLVVNPTHLAIALRYDEDDGSEAPVVVAKGEEHLARRMIEAAELAGVPVMRDVPLARGLYELDLGTEIPEALYEAVAAVLRIAWAERETSGHERG
jgi:flagellar biosynthesis protein FlhB